MSQFGQFIPGSGSGTPIETITGNTGGPIGPDGSNNINILGSGTISVVGSGNTLTISDSSSGSISLIDGTSNQISVANGSGPTATLSIPSTFIAPGSVQVTSGFTVAAGVITTPLTTAGIVTTSSGGVISSEAVVPTANGGTNTSVTPGTDAIIYFDGTRYVGLTNGTTGQVLNANTSAAPSWGAGGSGVTLIDGTASEITVTNGSGPTATISLPSAITTPGSLTTTTFLTTGTNINLPTTTASAGQLTINGNNTLHSFNGPTNIFVGYQAGNTSTVIGVNNTVMGYQAGLAMVGADSNVLIGQTAGTGITSGSSSIIIGQGSGSNYTTESNNICIGNPGTSSLQNSIIIGTQGSSTGEQNFCQIAGIYGVTVSSPQFVTIDSAGQLGSSSGGSGVALIDGTASEITVTNGSGPTATISLPSAITAPGSLTTTTTLATGTNILLPATTASTSGVLEINSNPWLHAYGTDNTFVGQSAGNFTLTTGSATYNTGIGYIALNTLTTGARNTAIGFDAMSGTTTGSDNTSLGFGSLGGGAVLTGNGNVALGYAAMGSGDPTSSAYNISIGYQSLYALVTGIQNIAIGGNNSTHAGGSYNGAESNNILLNSNGVVGESNVLRIGQASGSGDLELDAAYIQGIYGVSPSSPQYVVINSAGQLGSTASVVSGTTNEITVTGSVISIPTGFIAPGSITSTTDITTGADVNLPQCSSSTAGVIYQNFLNLDASYGNQTLVHTYGDNGTNTPGYNTFVGRGAGNFTLTLGTARANTALGSGSDSSGTTYGPLTRLTSGSDNTVVGFIAGTEITSGGSNTIVGVAAGNSISTQSANTFVGYQAGNAVVAPNNTYIGYQAGYQDAGSVGAAVAIGYQAMAGFTGASTTNGNIAIGALSLDSLLSGHENTVIGYDAASAYVGSESYNITIGTSVTGVASESSVLRIGNTTNATPGAGVLSAAYIQGIFGKTVNIATGTPVFIDTTGLLGTVNSSRRYKENIQDMATDSSDILKLRPVTFSYKKDPSSRKQTGLIAEEVETIMPQLATYDKDGQPDGVKYHDLPALLLNEVQKLTKRVEELESQLKRRK
jgi:trimeric autotransporter adhesin